jgi:lipopolysaccharide export system protein LptA
MTWKISILGFFLINNLQGIDFRPPVLESFTPLRIENLDSKSNNTPKKANKQSSTWGGNSLIQETKNIEGIDVTVYSLSGGAWIQHKKVKISSSSIEVLGMDAYKGYIKGALRVEDPENGIVLTSGRGVYDKTSETIVLEGSPNLVFKDKENKITRIYSPDLTRFLAENRTDFSKGVVIQNSEFTIFASKASFYEKEQRLELFDKPFIFGKDLFISGDKATHILSDKITEVEGSTLLVRQGIEKKKNKEGEEVSEKKITYSTGNKIYSKNQDEFNTGIYGNAKVIRQDMELSAEKIESIGKSSDKIQATQTVSILLKENHTRLNGNLLEHIKEKNYTHLTEEASIDFLSNDDSEVKSSLTASEIERFGNLKEIVCRGNVEIKSENSTLNGEYATYFEETEKLFLEGNPSMERDNKKIYSGRIILFPKLNKILLTDGLNISNQK